jgi:hypothetical protein
VKELPDSLSRDGVIGGSGAPGLAELEEANVNVGISRLLSSLATFTARQLLSATALPSRPRFVVFFWPARPCTHSDSRLIVYRCSAGGDVIEALGIQHKLKLTQMNDESSKDVMLVVYCAWMRYQSAELSSA